MLNSGLCETGVHAPDILTARQFSRPTAAQGEGNGLQQIRRVSKDFASVFYTTMVQQMQRGLRPAKDEDSVSEGVRGLLGMYLPGALVQSPSDPLTSYIYEQLSVRHGEVMDETG